MSKYMNKIKEITNFGGCCTIFPTQESNSNNSNIQEKETQPKEPAIGVHA